MERVILGQGIVDMRGTVVQGNAQLRLHKHDSVTGESKLTKSITNTAEVLKDISNSDVTITFTTTHSIDRFITMLQHLKKDMDK